MEFGLIIKSLNYVYEQNKMNMSGKLNSLTKWVKLNYIIRLIRFMSQLD